MIGPFDFAGPLSFWSLLFSGLLGTLKLAAVALVAGSLLGFVVAIGKLSKHAIFRIPAVAYVELFQNTPALVQLFWFFYAVPILTGIQQNVFVAAAIALSLNAAAYMGEIFRAGIQSIGRGQWEAGLAIGIRRGAIMRHVVLPQAIRRMLPAYTNRAIELVKTTSLASALAYNELLYQGAAISSETYRPIETYALVALIYVIVLSILSQLARLLENYLRRSE